MRNTAFWAPTRPPRRRSSSSRGLPEVVDRVAAMLKQATGKDIEVMVYGDGGFGTLSAASGSWPTRWSPPAYTAGLVGTPNELKLKYLAD